MNEVLNIFQSYRRILCLCPKCKQMMRLSDLNIRYEGKMPKTWLDQYRLKLMGLQKKEEVFDEKEGKIRDKAVERGRRRVPEIVNKCLCPEIAKMKYDPYDIKAIMHPVDFVVFNGLNNGKMVNDITFLARKTVNKNLGLLIDSIGKTVEKKNYDWKVARINMEGKVEYE